MLTGLCAVLMIALATAFGAIVLGRNLTRSLASGFVSMAAIGLALLIAESGFLSFVVVILGAVALATLQLFGWMLVDFDRDHLPSTDRPTWIARGLAFILLGGGLSLLAVAAIDRGELDSTVTSAVVAGPREIGLLLFGSLQDVAVLLGFAVAASLLAALLLLNDDGENE